MNRKNKLLAAGAVAVAVLAAGGWAGYQYLAAQAGPGCSLRGYDARSPASTAPFAEDVFTGRVLEFEERTELEDLPTDVYRVEVESVLRGDVRGTVRVTFAPDEEPARRLADGVTYVFATQEAKEYVEDSQAQLFQGEMKPADGAQLRVWKRAAALPVLTA
ncbi:hypothetical protein ACFYVL_41705 [Streptomyces sp. NPDC004111]|uniref:hypothetical protein n=1 Tax=Streptomyces sp. NPDC004111 TaxID=3364690 RepID=UPI00369BE705